MGRTIVIKSSAIADKQVVDYLKERRAEERRQHDKATKACEEVIKKLSRGVSDIEITSDGGYLIKVKTKSEYCQQNDFYVAKVKEIMQERKFGKVTFDLSTCCWVIEMKM